MDKRARRGIGWVGALGALVLLTMIAHAAGDTPEVTVGFDPSLTYLTDDPDAAVIGVTVDSAATDLKGFSLVILFDGSFVVPFSVTPGSLLVNAGCEYFLEWRNDGDPVWEPGIGDSLCVDGALLGDCSVAGPGELFEVLFVKPEYGIGETELLCDSDSTSDPILRDSQNASYFWTCEPGTISAPIAVENMSWGRIKAEYR